MASMAVPATPTLRLAAEVEGRLFRGQSDTDPFTHLERDDMLQVAVTWHF